MSFDSMKIMAEVPFIGSFEFYIHSRFDRYISEYLRQQKIWEPFETELFRRLCRPGDFVVDVGANIGWYSAIASRLVGENGRVMSIEPDPGNLRLLMKNMKNSPRTVPTEFLNIALGDIETDSKLFLSPDNLGDHHLFDDGETRQSVSIKVRTLDALLKWVPQKPTLIKADTQGSECRILRGASRLFAEGWRPVFILEFWPYGLTRSGSDPLEIWRILAAMGYGVYGFNEENPRLTCLTEAELVSRIETDIAPQSQSFINLLCLPPQSDRLNLIRELMG